MDDCYTKLKAGIAALHGTPVGDELADLLDRMHCNVRDETPDDQIAAAVASAFDANVSDASQEAQAAYLRMMKS